jgi:hypothetical protein
VTGDLVNGAEIDVDEGDFLPAPAGSGDDDIPF